MGRRRDPRSDGGAAAAERDPERRCPGFPGIPDPVPISSCARSARTTRSTTPARRSTRTSRSEPRSFRTSRTSRHPIRSVAVTRRAAPHATAATTTMAHANPTIVQNDDGTTTAVVDPTTKHREFDAATQDEGTINGEDQLIGHADTAQQQLDTNRAQQKAYSADHTMSTAITTDTCGLCHGFVTRINYAYQGMAEEEQRDQLSRRAEVDFQTPAGTNVRIVNSWVHKRTIRTRSTCSRTATATCSSGANRRTASRRSPRLARATRCLHRQASSPATAAARRTRTARTATTTASSRPRSSSRIPTRTATRPASRSTRT